MSNARGEGQSDTATENQKAVWSFFDAYKVSGTGQTVVRPELRSFRHVAEDSLARDEALLAKKKGRPNMREQKQTGSDAFAFENFLTAEAKRCRWFGGELLPTTEYDDWVSGVDAVIEWSADDGGPPLRLAVDFTSTTRDETIAKKSDKLEGNVVVKYLRSELEREDGVPREMRASMPLVLLGFDKEGFREIARQGKPVGPDHPLCRFLLEQTAAQVDLQIALLREFVDGTQMARHGRSFEEVLDLGVHPKIKRRYLDLVRLKPRVDAELERARVTVLFDETWERAAAASKTHRILSGR